MADDPTDEWAEELLGIEELLGEAYGRMQALQAEMKAAGRKKDWQALSEPMERLARYGRLFGEMRADWDQGAE